jgi:thioredoxin 1
MIHEIKSLEELKKWDHHSKIIVIKFTAGFCGPCKKIQPIYDAISKSNKNIICAVVDVQKSPEVSDHFGITALPTFKFLKNGTEVHEELKGADSEKLKSITNKFVE